MLCYPCAKNGVERRAVALCTSCSAGLCQGHLSETATQLASDNPFAGCRHDTWAAAPGRPERLATGSWLHRALRRDHMRPARPRRVRGRTAVDRLRDQLVRESGSRVPRRRGERR